MDLSITSIHDISVADDWMQQENEGTSQKQRHYRLHQACEVTKKLRSNDTLDYLVAHPNVLSKMIYNDEYKLIYCYTAKVRYLGGASGQEIRRRQKLISSRDLKHASLLLSNLRCRYATCRHLIGTRCTAHCHQCGSSSSFGKAQG